MLENMFKKMYEHGDPPWELHRPDDNLIKIIHDYKIAPAAEK